MKTVRIVFELKVTDDFFDNDLKELKNSILSGSYQRELVDGKNCIKAKATFEEIK